MMRPIEEPTMLDLALEHADDDVAREYEELSEMEDLGAVAPSTGGEGALLEVAGELAFVRDELEELAALEARGDYASTRMAEAETTEDRVARRFEGIDVDELDALAHWDEEAESRAAPDDEIERGVEMMEGWNPDDSAPQPTYVCDQSATLGMCVEHGPLDEYGVGASRFACESQGSTWGTTPCPTANLIASCRMGTGQGGGFQYYYAGFTGDLAYVASQCTMYGGTWTTYAQ